MFDSVNIDELDDESSFDRQSVVAPFCHADALQIHRAATHEIMNCEDWSLISNLDIIGAWPVGQCQCSLCGRSRNTVSRRHSPHFVWSQGKERVHKCPSSIVSSNSASEGFASLLIKPEVVSTHVNAQVWLFADECDQWATELICLSWTWLVFSTTGGCGRGVFVAPLAEHLQHQIHRGPQRSWSTSFMLYTLVISGTMTYTYIILLCMNHIHSRQPYSWCADPLVNWWWLLHGLAGYTFRLLHATSKRSHDSYVFG